MKVRLFSTELTQTPTYLQRKNTEALMLFDAQFDSLDANPSSSIPRLDYRQLTVLEHSHDYLTDFDNTPLENF